MMSQTDEQSGPSSPAPASVLDKRQSSLDEGDDIAKEASANGSGRSLSAQVPKQLEELFLTMHHRKMQRDLNGPQKKKSKWHLIVLLCFLILVYGLSAYSRDGGGESIQITLTLDQIILIGAWIFLAIVITAIFGSSKFILVLYWMLVYWPLLYLLATVLTDNWFSDSNWIIYILIILEAVTLLAFVMVNYVYPKLVTSKWFCQTYGARRFWRIRLLEDGTTMEYDGMWGRLSKRYECRYVGETNKEGLPHGRGIWSDDSYNGEVLTGSWEDGHPIAPFSSRQYGGKGNTFSAVRLAYFMATDDSFEANKLIPTNENRPRCGEVSVECSIAGDFMSHLPEASLVGNADPRVEGDGITIGECCKQLDSHTSSSEGEDSITSLQISTNDPRGVQIGGHLYVPTGLPFTKRVKQVIIDVIRTDTEAKYDALNAIDEENSVKDREEQIDPTISTAGVSSWKLEVKNWTRIGTKDALIFIPGFNSWLKNSAETLGQLMAMTKLSQTVYPVLYAWPGGQVPTYMQAKRISASENNHNYFLQMLRSLQAEGITNIHIVTHSLGVQTLVNCFKDRSDGSPSQVSQCFGRAPESGDYSPSIAQFGKLVCRSITMLNPDYPVAEFRENGFQSLRRVTSLITVVGDKADQALFWSSVMNGAVNGFHSLEPRIGRNIDLLYVKEGKDRDGNTVAFQNGSLTSQSIKRGREDEAAKVWLDCDVIDTTGLDTNVNNLRHSAFSVNSILLRDIEELVVTGKRATDRTTLLYKNGNMFEYCHAPSFVTPD